MAINKVLKDGQTLIDLSQDTVTTAADIALGKVGHLADGTVATGTHQGGVTPTGKLNITGTSEVDVTNYATAQVVDADLVASNIKKDVNILGITGTYEGSGGGGEQVVEINGITTDDPSGTPTIIFRLVEPLSVVPTTLKKLIFIGDAGSNIVTYLFGGLGWSVKQEYGELEDVSGYFMDATITFNEYEILISGSYLSNFMGDEYDTIYGCSIAVVE